MNVFYHLLPYIEETIKWIFGVVRGWGGWG